MGADMIVVCIPACEITGERRRALEEILEQLVVSNIDENLFCLSGIDETEEGSEQEQEALTKARDMLRAAIEDISPNLYGNRYVCGLKFEGMQYEVHLTGGFSCGDSQTEIFDTFSIINACEPIYAKLLEWAKEDALVTTAS